MNTILKKIAEQLLEYKLKKQARLHILSKLLGFKIKKFRPKKFSKKYRYVT